MLPRAEHLYDLFCGGCAISHCALDKSRYNHVHVNDINAMMPHAFITALQGGFENEDRWISREEFFRLKDTDPYVAICFSFGNDLKTYCYGRDIEETNKALHYAIFFGSYELSDSLLGVDLRPIERCATKQEKYLMAKRIIQNTPHKQECWKVGSGCKEYRLQSWERLHGIGEVSKKKSKSCRVGNVSTEYHLAELAERKSIMQNYPPIGKHGTAFANH